MPGIISKIKIIIIKDTLNLESSDNVAVVVVLALNRDAERGSYRQDVSLGVRGNDRGCKII